MNTANEVLKLIVNEALNELGDDQIMADEQIKHLEEMAKAAAQLGKKAKDYKKWITKNKMQEIMTPRGTQLQHQITDVIDDVRDVL